MVVQELFQIFLEFHTTSVVAAVGPHTTIAIRLVMVVLVEEHQEVDGDKSMSHIVSVSRDMVESTWENILTLKMDIIAMVLTLVKTLVEAAVVACTKAEAVTVGQVS